MSDAIEWNWQGASRYEAKVPGGVLVVDAVAAGVFAGRYECHTNPANSRTSTTNRTNTFAARADAESCYRTGVAESEVVRRAHTEALKMNAEHDRHARLIASASNRDVAERLIGIMPNISNWQFAALVELYDEMSATPTALAVVGALITWSTVDYPNGTVELDVCGNITAVTINDLNGVENPELA